MIWNTAKPWPTLTPTRTPEQPSDCEYVQRLGRYGVIIISRNQKNTGAFNHFIQSVFSIMQPRQHIKEYSRFKNMVRDPLYDIYVVLNQQDRPVAIIIARGNKIISYFCQSDAWLLQLLKRIKIYHPDFNIICLLRLISQS